MRLSMHWVAALLAYGCLVFCGPLRAREEISNSSPLNVPGFTDIFSTMPTNPSPLFAPSDTPSNNANWPSDMLITSPSIPSDVIAQNMVLPQQEGPDNFRVPITPEIERSFLKIKDGSCRYGLYNLSPDRSKFVFSVCGQSWDWEDFRDAIYDSNQPGFAIRPVEVGRILDPRILVIDYLVDAPNFDFDQEYSETQSRDNASQFVSGSSEAWLKAVSAAFAGRNVKVISLKISDPVTLLELGAADPL